MQTLDSYIRVSKTGNRDGESYITVEEQRKLIQQTAERTGVKLGMEIVEEDVSGAKRASDRKLGQLLERVEAGDSDGIVVAFQDRLSRSTKDSIDVWERLEKAGARFISADGADNRLPGQELLFTIKAGIAREQWKRYRQNFQIAVKSANERGIKTSAPFGYKRDPVTRRLVVDRQTAPLVRELFERRSVGQGWASLVRLMDEQGHRLSRQGIVHVLGNRAYLGEVRTGEYLLPAAHEPIVSPLLFERAQQATTRTLREGTTGAVTGKVIAQGIATCESCGYRLQSTGVSKRPDGRTRGLSMYCYNDLCSTKASITAEMLDAEIERQVMSRLSVATRAIYTLPEQKSDRRQAEVKLAEAEHARDAWLENTDALPLIGKDKWNSTLARLAARVDAAKANLVAAADADEEPVQWTRLREAWLGSDVLGRRDLLLRVVESIVVRPVHGRRGVPAEERVLVVFKSSKAKPVKIGLAKSA